MVCRVLRHVLPGTSGFQPAVRHCKFDRAGWATLCGVVVSIILSLPISLLAEPVGCKDLPEALKIASSLRGLTIKSIPACHELTAAEFEKRLKVKPDASINSQSIVYKLLGIIPDDYPYENCLTQVRAENAAASYDPFKKEVIIPNWKETALEILVHEATHILQDQHFNLARIREAHSNSTDAYLAHSAIIEGDASFVQEQYRTGVRSKVSTANSLAPKTSNCTSLDSLERIYNFPYDHGIITVDRILQSSGKELLNNYFTNPPTSTREILYLSKLATRTAKRDKMNAVRFSSRSQPGHRLIFSDQMGELMIRTVLKIHNNAEKAILGAKGWKGDELKLFSSNKSTVLYWETVWEDEADADQFRRGLLLHLGAVYKEKLQAESKSIKFTPNSRNDTQDKHDKLEIDVQAHASVVSLRIDRHIATD